MEDKIVILLPSLNEEEHIGKLIKDIQAINSTWEILVADSLSTDNTVEIAYNLNASILLCPKGKSEAFFYAIERINTDYLVMIDSDGTYPPAWINTILYYLRNRKADSVVGYRIGGLIEPGALSMSHLVGNLWLTLIANLCYNYNNNIINDVCSGMWGFNRVALKLLERKSKGFCLEANLYTETCKKHLRFKQVPIVYTNREGTKPKIKYKDAFKIGTYLLKERL